MPIRLIAVDLDGTLLTSKREMHPHSVEALRRAHEAGIVVVLASGRIRTSMLPFAQELGFNAPMICGNGAHVVDENGHDIAHWPLPHAVFDIVWPYCREVGAHVNVYTRTDLVFLDESPFGDEYARRLKTMSPRVADAESMRDEEITKVLVMDFPERIPDHRRVLENRIDPSLGRATVSEPDYLEFLATGISKGRALETLCKHLNIDREGTAAIGDYMNDAEMIRWACNGAAVANAHPELRKIAQVVVSSNEDGGVGQFVDGLLRDRRQ